MRLWHLLRYGALDHTMLLQRDDVGRLTQCCSVCGVTRVVLGEPPVKNGPAHTQARDLGAVTTKAKLTRTGHIREWRRSER